MTALAFAVHLADTPWRKARYMDALTRYASYVLEGCDSPPGNESARWGHVIGLEPHPYSWVIQTGPDKGADRYPEMPTPRNCSWPPRNIC